MREPENLDNPQTGNDSNSSPDLMSPRMDPSDGNRSNESLAALQERMKRIADIDRTIASLLRKRAKENAKVFENL
jgi:hypothetical protein